MAIAFGQYCHPKECPLTPQTIIFSVPEGQQLIFRNIKLKPLETKPLFNGKDLTGWKKFTRQAGNRSSPSRKEGWLSSRTAPAICKRPGNGPISSCNSSAAPTATISTAASSSAAFPASIRTATRPRFTIRKPRNRKQYTIDEYDPKTHKLKAKKKIENWSQDYGTGAIYRRMPARRAVAQGQRMVHDDRRRSRPAHRHLGQRHSGGGLDRQSSGQRQPRNGCRLKKGAISLQGHDPTTDLSFRNIRIADLVEQKKGERP